VRWLAASLLLLSFSALPQETAETRELVGKIGARSALAVLHASKRGDGSWRVTGEYLTLPQLQRRYLEGERSAQLGVLFLKEGESPILWARPASATFQGTWRDGRLRGTRYGPGGQERERFELSENFPALASYTAAVRCEAGDERYHGALAFAVEAGQLKAGSFEWSSRLAPSGHGCAVKGLEQKPFKGGLAFAAGRCTVTLRDLGEYVRVSAEDCAGHCGSGGYLEPMLVDRRGACRLLRPR
jgi:hypothetical protein